MSIPVQIIADNGRQSIYTQRELAREVRSLSRLFKFRLRDITETYVQIQPNASVTLRVYHRQADGLIAIAGTAL